MERTKTLEVKIRDAGYEDYQKIKEISKKAFSHVSIDGTEHKSMNLQLEEYFANIKKYDIWDMDKVFEKKVFLSQKVYVAEGNNGKVIGYTGIERPNIDGDAQGAYWLNWTAVDPEYQGCCVGKKMILKAIKETKKLGGLTLSVKTHSFLEPAHKTYEKLGFKVTGRILNYHKKGHDLVIFSLNLVSINLDYYKKMLR